MQSMRVFASKKDHGRYPIFGTLFAAIISYKELFRHV